MELLENITQAEIAVAIATIPLVVKGITSKFNIKGSNQKELIAFLVAVGAFIYLMYKDNSIIQTIALFIMLYAGGTGIYNFMPQSMKNKELISDEVIEIDIDDEQIKNELGKE